MSFGSQNLFAAILLLVVLLIGSAFVVFIFEKSTNPSAQKISSVFGWMAITLASGPPWKPTTVPAKVALYFLQIVKPSLFAIVTAAATSKLIQLVIRRDRGMGESKLTNHIVICGWSGKGSEIIQEIRRRSDQDSEQPIVVLASLQQDPTADTLTTFISGDPTNAKDLSRAGIEHAATAIVLADNSYADIDVEDMDSRTLLTTLAIESINPDCYTCVEVIRSENLDHFSRTKADELVVSAKLTGSLLAHSAVAHGLTFIVGDLLTYPSGNEFYWVDVPAHLVGRSFKDALVALKMEFDCTSVALAREGIYVSNPPAEVVLGSKDRILVISEGQPRSRP